MSDERAKDPMILFRSVIRGKNKKGGDRTQLYLTTDEAKKLVETINGQITNPKGVKVDLHITQKTHQGRQFDSAIAFVKAVSDGPAMGAPQRSFAPAANQDMEAQIAALKAQLDAAKSAVAK